MKNAAIRCSFLSFGLLFLLPKHCSHIHIFRIFLFLPYLRFFHVLFTLFVNMEHKVYHVWRVTLRPLLNEISRAVSQTFIIWNLIANFTLSTFPIPIDNGWFCLMVLGFMPTAKVRRNQNQLIYAYKTDHIEKHPGPHRNCFLELRLHSFLLLMKKHVRFHTEHCPVNVNFVWP